MQEQGCMCNSVCRYVFMVKVFFCSFNVIRMTNDDSNDYDHHRCISSKALD